MPKVTPLIPTDILLAQLDTLSGLIQIIPEQASMLLGISVDQLKKNRNEGRPPPHTKEGGSIRYKLEVVRDYLKKKPSFDNSNEAAIWSSKNHTSFSAFMDHAGMNDPWPFMMRQGKPVDLFASLSMEIDEESHGAWFTLREYCSQRVTGESLLTNAPKREVPLFPEVLPFADFTDFMTRAGTDDTWPFLIVNEKPMDLFSTLQLEVNEDETVAEWLSLSAYCSERIRAEQLHAAQQEKEELLEWAEKRGILNKDKGSRSGL